MLTTLPTTIHKDLALQAGGKDKMPFNACISFGYEELDAFVALIEEQQIAKQYASSNALQKILIRILP